jgi:hypothetical protein
VIEGFLLALLIVAHEEQGNADRPIAHESLDESTESIVIDRSRQGYEQLVDITGRPRSGRHRLHQRHGSGVPVHQDSDGRVKPNASSTTA